MWSASRVLNCHMLMAAQGMFFSQARAALMLLQPVLKQQEDPGAALSPPFPEH